MWDKLPKENSLFIAYRVIIRICSLTFSLNFVNVKRIVGLPHLLGKAKLI